MNEYDEYVLTQIAEEAALVYASVTGDNPPDDLRGEIAQLADLIQKLAENVRDGEELSEQREKYVEACRIADGYREALAEIENNALADPVNAEIARKALRGEGE